MRYGNYQSDVLLELLTIKMPCLLGSGVFKSYRDFVGLLRIDHGFYVILDDSADEVRDRLFSHECPIVAKPNKIN